MEDRLKRLMRLVAEDVIKTGEPVGSQRLVDAYPLGVSSATIRNWFAELEEAEYLVQPHTSSGRVPTEKGYRFYVDELMEPAHLTAREKQALEKSEDAKRFAKVSAELVGSAAFLGTDADDSYYTGLSHLFAQPEFREWSRVVSLGEVLDRMDDVLRMLRREKIAGPTVRIGSACPFGPACSTVLVTLKDGTLFGILGPQRMDYRQSLAILNAATEILSK